MPAILRRSLKLTLAAALALVPSYLPVYAQSAGQDPQPPAPTQQPTTDAPKPDATKPDSTKTDSTKQDPSQTDKQKQDVKKPNQERPRDAPIQQQDTVHHVHHALDLTAKVGVPGRIDDIDLHAAIGDRRVLGDDGDAALALEVAPIHDALAHVLVGAKDVALLKHPVHERRLAVVDMRDNGDIADL